MAHGTHDSDDIISGINVTPLVDIVLVILIIFIVTASVVFRNNIPLDLPAAATGEESPSGLLNVAITDAGEIYINGRPETLDALPAAVDEAREKLGGPGSKVSAFVSADVKAQYGAFAKVVDRLRLLGVINIALDTQPVDLAAEGEAG